VFERLHVEGYLSSRVGRGTWVNRVATVDTTRAKPGTPPRFVRRIVSGHKWPKAWVDVTVTEGLEPFQMRDPAIAEFPSKLWGSLAARRARGFGSWLRTRDDGRGYRPLREAITHYLGMSRGVRCSPDQIIVVSGVQQALDLLARFLVKPSEPVWMEDPGYFGAQIAFSNVGAKIVPVPVDQ